MSNVINFNEFKSKKNRISDIQIAKKYLFSISPESLEVSIADKVMDLVYDFDNANVKVNFSQLSKELNTTVYKIKKAYNNLLDNKVLIELSKESGKPVRVSSKNLMLSLNLTEYIEAYL